MTPEQLNDLLTRNAAAVQASNAAMERAEALRDRPATTIGEIEEAVAEVEARLNDLRLLQVELAVAVDGIKEDLNDGLARLDWIMRGENDDGG